MAMRLALVIDGDATGAKKAADETVRGLRLVGQEADQAVTKYRDLAQGLNRQLNVRDDFGGAARGRDIEAYGRALDDLRAKFNPLFAAGREYKQTLAEIARAHAVGAISDKERAAAVTDTKVAFVQQVNSLRGVNDAFNSAAGGSKNFTTQTGLARHELINLGRQAQDIGVSLASGQSPMMVLIQQGTQIADVFAASKGSVGGAMRQIAAGVMSVITPFTVLTAGAVALGVAGYAIESSWRSAVLQLDDTARIAGVATDRLHDLQSAAAFKGIDDGAFLGAIEKFSQATYEAQHNTGSLAELFRATGTEVGNVEQNLQSVADIIRRSGDDQERLVRLGQANLPANMQWVRLLSSGREGLQSLVNEATKFGGAANSEMIAKAREADEAWDRMWRNFATGAKRAVLEARGALAGAMQSGTDWYLGLFPGRAQEVGRQALRDRAGSTLTQSDADRFYDSTGRPRQDGTADFEAQRRNLSFEAQRISLLGETASVLDQVRVAELAVQQARAAGLNRSGFDLSRQEVEKLKERARERALGIAQIKQATDAQRVEAETIGMNAGQAAAYSAAQGAINDRLREGKTLREEDIASINQHAAALGKAAQRTDDLRANYDIAKGALSTFRTELQNGTGWLEASFKAALNALNRLADRMLDLAFNDLWKAAMGSVGGGAGQPLNILPGHAAGGYTGDVGRGRVAGVVHGQEYVVNARQTARHRPLLEAINAGRVPGYADGGFVGPLANIMPPPPRWSVGTGDAGRPIVLNNPIYNYAPVQVEQRKASDGVSTETIITPLDNAMAQRVMRGRGATQRAIEARANNRHLRGA